MEIYIEYLNKDDAYKVVRKSFDSFDSARSWGQQNIDNFILDMIKIKLKN
jgi:hypothetical protein